MEYGIMVGRIRALYDLRLRTGRSVMDGQPARFIVDADSHTADLPFDGDVRALVDAAFTAGIAAALAEARTVPVVTPEWAADVPATPPDEAGPSE